MNEQKKNIGIVDLTLGRNAMAKELADDLGVEILSEPETHYVLEFSNNGVRLLDNRGKSSIVTKGDFTAGAVLHRMLYGGGKGQLLAKAVGLSSRFKPKVLDATAGLGKDAFVLASLGCEVQMLERSPIAYALLDDALVRAKNQILKLAQDDPFAGAILRLGLKKIDAKKYMEHCESEKVNTVYLDPMFPGRNKSAQVKKEMLAFQQTIGKDPDADLLLQTAMDFAENRVVVKRPASAPFLAGKGPNYQLKGKSSRFDVYTLKKMP